MAHDSRAYDWAWSQTVTPVGRLVVLLALARHADNRTGQCFPSIRTIAALTNLAERTVRRYLDELEADGYLVKLERKRRDNGTLGVWVYRLNLDQRPPKASGDDQDEHTEPAAAEGQWTSGRPRQPPAAAEGQNQRPSGCAQNLPSELPKRTPPTPADAAVFDVLEKWGWINTQNRMNQPGGVYDPAAFLAKQVDRMLHSPLGELAARFVAWNAERPDPMSADQLAAILARGSAESYMRRDDTPAPAPKDEATDDPDTAQVIPLRPRPEAEPELTREQRERLLAENGAPARFTSRRNGSAS